MKRILILLLGVTIVSCSTDNVNEKIEKNKEITTIDPSMGYESPIQGTCCYIGNHIIRNSSNLTLSFRSFMAPARAIASLSGFGSYIGFDMHQMSNFFPNVSIPYMTFVPSINTTVVPPNNSKFVSGSPVVLTGNTPPTGANDFFVQLRVSPYELGFIYETGKIFFIEYRITDNSNLVKSGFLKFKFVDDTEQTPFNDFGNWIYMGNFGPSNDPFYYFDGVFGSGDLNHSFEIVIGNGDTPMPSKVDFNYNGNNYNLRAFTTSSDFRIELH